MIFYTAEELGTVVWEMFLVGLYNLKVFYKGAPDFLLGGSDTTLGIKTSEQIYTDLLSDDEKYSFVRMTPFLALGSQERNYDVQLDSKELATVLFELPLHDMPLYIDQPFLKIVAAFRLKIGK